jgi:hypothetical protein
MSEIYEFISAPKAEILKRLQEFGVKDITSFSISDNDIELFKLMPELGLSIDFRVELDPKVFIKHLGVKPCQS